MVLRSRDLPELTEHAIRIAQLGDVHAGHTLVELLEAEEARLIDAEWRKCVDVDAVLEQLSALADEFVAEWRDDYEWFRIQFGEDDYDDQTIDDIAMIFTRRTALELGRRFVPQDVYAQIYLIDEEFRKFVGLVQKRIKQVRHNWGFSLCINLPKHWWWRADLEGIPEPWEVRSAPARKAAGKRRK